jgi:hypothetical protein
LKEDIFDCIKYFYGATNDLQLMDLAKIWILENNQKWAFTNISGVLIFG